ncbi:ankyrin repeat and SAM domain-containing protein 3 [Solea senegalensis]|uniref:Ankyrin repeat and SAM domain-containing protein 3 n=1 Tax=Solea senegalensis TaxID=28829 RepID=A0AAV6RRT6_SOLSE|nr:ankyrin repeat and SAM domain-containing protein 3 [Solea senegalensis]
MRRGNILGTHTCTDLFFSDTGDIDPKPNSSAPPEARADQPLWTRSDNTFRFNFLSDNCPRLKETKPPLDWTKPAQSQISFTREGSAFAFNFHIPAASPVEDMETTETPDTCATEGKDESTSSLLQDDVNSPPELSAQSKAKKKKKKSGKSKVSHDTESQQKPAEGSQGDDHTELSAEEQLNRQLDWCMEQLELGMKSQKGTPKQKEEASRALKTLRSSKAPLVKKRQVMRAMTGEYRKKMEEEKNKQFKLIQSEIASAQVKVVSDSPKKAVVHRIAHVKMQNTKDNNLQQAEAQDADKTPETQEGTSTRVFTPVTRQTESLSAEKNKLVSVKEGRVRRWKMSELSDEASESEQLGVSLSLWLGDSLVRPEELDVPLDLHTACSIGQYDVVAGCIKQREVNLDGKNIGGWTPLMYASYIGHDNIANLLLEAGVNVNATTAKGLTPLMLAASCGNESIAYFLLQQGAELELKDSRGWTALFHCTGTGHQQMVKFLLDNNADANVKEPGSGVTPLMEAAASGHEIIVQYLLDHKVKVDDRNAKGETARALAMMYGFTKIVSLIDSRSPRIKPGHFEDLSSSEDSDSTPPRIRPSRNRAKGVSIHDGPQAIAKFRVGGTSKLCEPAAVPPGYMTFRDIGGQSEGLCYRDVTSPINELDGQSNSSSRDDSPFFDNDMPTMRSSSSSSEGLPHVIGLNWEGSVESNEDSDQCKKSSSRRVNKGHHSKGKNRHGNNDAAHSSGTGNCGIRSHVVPPPSYTGPKDLAEFLEQIGFSKYLPLLEEQDIDLRIFLTLTENDLKEIGITLFGPKRKMTSAIARWHSSARPPGDALEQAYADQLEAEMQEMAIQLHKRCEEMENLQSQVSQEKELRTVMEGCLMEDKMAWKRVHTELVENHRLAQDMSATLAKARTCCAELLSGVTSDGNGCLYTGADNKAKDDTGVKAGGLASSKVVELMKTLDSHEDQLAGTLNTMLQSLRRLSAPEKVSDSWERP